MGILEDENGSAATARFVGVSSTSGNLEQVL
jgi:hypothetical protein